MNDASGLPLEALAGTIRAHISAGDKAIDKAEQHYKAAGIHLMEAKERVKQTPGLTWPAYLHSHCQLQRRRADELIAIAEGRTTLAEVREKKAASMRETRARRAESAPRGAQSPRAAAEQDNASPAVDDFVESLIEHYSLDELPTVLAWLEETNPTAVARRLRGLLGDARRVA
ncbi:hypothetical protein [Chelatococcus asaccharovorans]|uniref:hypothetical protein n=1 Tax=Chelatococcus asaccharovorans TaxID=28210 RepID=UPI00224C74AD|nr:hypothetical protein [Chelatococcus asaccharovorans]CAH1649578.1 hypothetical protein CHELA40_10243 [Chelatococcus asaccharovorans]CAH1686957.1 hypothetical protein CHELA17_65366 [Chelatococcus asaccharovorans]